MSYARILLDRRLSPPVRATCDPVLGSHVLVSWIGCAVLRAARGRDSHPRASARQSCREFFSVDLPAHARSAQSKPTYAASPARSPTLAPGGRPSRGMPPRLLGRPPLAPGGRPEGQSTGATSGRLACRLSPDDRPVSLRCTHGPTYS